jgi:hypothetical protein
VIAVVDQEAGRLLERRDYYRHVEHAQSLLSKGQLAALMQGTEPL